MEKILILFTNDNGQYMVEVVLPADEKHDFDMVFTIDETANLSNWEKTKQELCNPTTEDGQLFGVIQKFGRRF
jgi:hypothetical protein